jgi:hypothetical protein
MPERDYSQYVTNIVPKEDRRPFLVRLLDSIKISVNFSYKKGDPLFKDIQDKIKINIKGGTDF